MLCLASRSLIYSLIFIFCRTYNLLGMDFCLLGEKELKFTFFCPSTYRGCGCSPQWGPVWEAMIDVSLSCSHVSQSVSLSVSQINKHPRWGLKKLYFFPMWGSICPNTIVEITALFLKGHPCHKASVRICLVYFWTTFCSIVPSIYFCAGTTIVVINTAFLSLNIQ